MRGADRYRLSWLLLLTLAACRGPAGSETALIDATTAPDVLTESRPFEHPAAMSGNRFVRGWQFIPPEGRLRVRPAGERGRIEIVHLDARPRQLRLDVELADPAADAAVELLLPDGHAVRVPWTRPLDLPLPAGLPLGRVPLDLRLPEGARIVAAGSGLHRARPAGEVAIDGGDVAQAGWSRVDVVHRVEAGSVLLGRFVPPPDARPEQSFALEVEREGSAPEPVFTWRSGWASRLVGSRRLRVPLGDAYGLVRVRLVARGEGPPARWQGLRWRHAPHEEPEPVAPPPAPRVVVVYVLDALRADHLGHLGSGLGATPTLDRLAAEGVTFTRHLSVAPNTLPSTKSFFTGLSFLTLGHAKLPADGPATLAEIFAAAGYRTGAFSGNGNLSHSHGTVRGFERFARESERDRRKKSPYDDDAERVHAVAREWLDGLPPGERVFLYVHTLHPHNPFNPPAPFRETFVSDNGSRIDGGTRTLLRIKREKLAVDAADQERLRGLYTGGLAYNDALVGPFLEEIVARYPPGEVLLVLTSDHGEELFDHGGLLHGYTLYDEMLHIPLVFWWPARLPPGRVEAPTDNLDLHETLRELAGAPPSPGLGESRSLWPLLLRPEARGPRERVRFAAASSVPGGVFMARSERYKLVWAPRAGVRTGMGAGPGRTYDVEYFFDLAADPGETVNRAGEPSLAAAWLRGRLMAWVERGKALETGVEVTDLDDDTRRRLKALGYLE